MASASVGDCLSGAWGTFKKNVLTHVVCTLLVMVVAGISAGLSDGTTSITTYNSSGTTDASVWWVNGTEDPAGSVTAVLYDADGNVVQAGGFSSQFNSYVGGSYWTHSITISNAAVGPGYELRVVNSSGHAIDAYQSVATRATLP